MPRKLKTPEIIYEEADNINSPESKKALSDAYEILFEEVLKRRKDKQPE